MTAERIMLGALSKTILLGISRAGMKMFLGFLLVESSETTKRTQKTRRVASTRSRQRLKQSAVRRVAKNMEITVTTSPMVARLGATIFSGSTP